MSSCLRTAARIFCRSLIDADRTQWPGWGFFSVHEQPFRQRFVNYPRSAVEFLLSYPALPSRTLLPRQFRVQVEQSRVFDRRVLLSTAKMTEKVWDVLKKLKSLGENDLDFATLILNQPILCEPRLVKSLWNKAKFRMLVDGGTNRWLDFLQKHGVSDFALPDVISGDFDSIKQRTKAYFENKGVKTIFTPDQDETDFTKALRHLEKQIGNTIKYVFVICESSGRLDQILANINTLLRSQQTLPGVDVIMLSSETLTWIIPPGRSTVCIPDEFTARECNCGLIPVNGPTEVTTSGLKWNLDNQVMQFGELISTSNSFSDLEIHITCNRDLVFTTQYCRKSD